jgi:SAM-dependent methyltransferase
VSEGVAGELALKELGSQRGLANIETRLAAAEALPFADASFDAVLCRFSAHHWQDFEAGLRQARRVLKPGGLAVFIDIVGPASPLLDTHLQAMELLRDASHVRNYSVAEWAGAFSRTGFALRSTSLRRLRMAFATWVARTRTPPEAAAAIRALQQAAPPRVRTYFAIEDDGSFELEAAAFELN